MKSFLIAWIVIRSGFEASVWSTAAWCVLYALLRKGETHAAISESHGAFWFQLYGLILAIHLLLTSRRIGFLLNRSGKECQDFMRVDFMFVAGAILLAFITSVPPALGGIILLYIIFPWTGILPDWLPWWLFLLCMCYICFRATERQPSTRR